MKKLILLFLLSFVLCKAQNGCYMKGSTEYSFMMKGRMPAITTESYSKGNDYKVILMSNKDETVYWSKDENITVSTKENGKNQLCGQGTIKENDEFQKKMMETEASMFLDINVTELSETQTLLGYDCKKIEITYKQKIGMGFKTKVKETIWYTDKIKGQAGFAISSKEVTTAYKPYLDALKAIINGPILKKEVRAGGSVASVYTITEIVLKDIDDSDILFDLNYCKTLLMLKQYYFEINERAEAKRQNEAEMNARQH